MIKGFQRRQREKVLHRLGDGETAAFKGQGQKRRVKERR